MPQLTMRARRYDKREIPTWHDAMTLQYAIERIVTGKPVSKLGLWFGIAAKIEIAREENESQINADMVIELRGGEASALVKELKKLPPEAFGKHPMTGQNITPHVATLYEMLRDFEEQLEVAILPAEGDE